MIKTLALAVSLAALAGSPAFAAPCRDTHGKFIKCASAPAKPAAHCKDSKGKFAKCGTPGAKPV